MSDLEALDNDIGDLRTKIANLQTHRANLSAILLSHPHLPARLQQRPVLHERNRREAAACAEKQSKRNTENVYRACAGITAFKVKDPDPYAVDNGNVLGVRIEVSIGGRFIETYSVLFNRPNTQYKNVLRIHKHTIPPCIPLQPLANKWLPMSTKDAENAPEQNLIRFGKSLRKELVGWHLRMEAIEKLRAEAGVLEKSKPTNEEPRRHTIGNVLNAFVSDEESDEDDEDEDEDRNQADRPVRIASIDADAAGREITVTWTDQRIGIFKVAKDGSIDKAIVKDRYGSRDSALSRKAIGRMEGLVQRLTA
ncbi:hypothetical protein DM02DRAFT_77189 [Periconia macrospinosa]|uniref:Cenp-O kinetochore centromere component n=1 Tax=Periconia macrospinosa TaxID=97972 RepID=A0A2V1DIB1_9PLEO|nr:hypothetical protein DM02DRAFT_77189 [Periconia macrospinosa]